MIQEQQKTHCDRVTNDACINPFKLFLKGERHLKGQTLGWLTQRPFFKCHSSENELHSYLSCSCSLLICDLPTHSSAACMHACTLQSPRERSGVLEWGGCRVFLLCLPAWLSACLTTVSPSDTSLKAVVTRHSSEALIYIELPRPLTNLIESFPCSPRRRFSIWVNVPHARSTVHLQTSVRNSQ